MLVSAAFPSQVWLKKQLAPDSLITRRFMRVWHFFWPLSYACWSAGSCGRWIGRSGPSCQQGGTQGHPRSVSPHASPLTRQRCELEAPLGVLAPDSTRHGGDESTWSHSTGTSHRGAFARLGEGAVAQRARCRATCRPSGVQGNSHTYSSAGSFGAVHPWCGLPVRPERRVQNGAVGRCMPVGLRRSWPVSFPPVE
jgi:hypothetical protein